MELELDGEESHIYKTHTHTLWFSLSLLHTHKHTQHTLKHTQHKHTQHTQVELDGETVVAKYFDSDDFPFHEICGNVVGTSLLGQVGARLKHTHTDTHTQTHTHAHTHM